MKTTFKGKVAIVTGATKGIGKAIAESLKEDGCHVVCTGRSVKASSSKSQSYCPLDLCDDDSLQEFLDKIKDLSRVDILVNNAGINVIQSIDQIEKNDWDRILQVNLTAAMRLMKEVSVKMKKQKSGKILNISSIYGVISKRMRGAYSTSKAGLIGLTRASALDLAPYNILVNALCPGFVLTDLTRNILSKQEIKALSKQIPLGRFGTEKDMARVATFLCSDLNTYITGQTIVADGGITIQ